MTNPIKKKVDSKLVINLYESQTRIREPLNCESSPSATLSIDANGDEKWTDESERIVARIDPDHHGRGIDRRLVRPNFSVRIGNVLRCGVDVLNRHDRQPKLSAPGYTCNLLQIFNWLTQKYRVAKSRFAVSLAISEQNDDNIYEDIDGVEDDHDDDRPNIVERQPLDYYAEFFDDDLFRLPDNDNCNSLRLTKHRRHVIVSRFWLRGGEIIRLSTNTTINFRRRLQTIHAFEWRGCNRRVYRTIDLDMLLPLGQQLEALNGSNSPRPNERGIFSGITLKFDRITNTRLGQSLSSDCVALHVVLRRNFGLLIDGARSNDKPSTPSTTNNDVALQLRVDLDTRASLELGFFPWESYPCVELNCETNSCIVRTNHDSSPSSSLFSLVDNCCPVSTVNERARNVITLVAELIHLTDDSALRLRFGEFVGKLSRRRLERTAKNGTNAPAVDSFNSHLDKFACEHVDPTLEKLTNNRTLWGRLTEEATTNARLPNSVALSVAVVARDVVNDDDGGDALRLFWNSVDSQSRLSAIRPLGRIEAVNASDSIGDKRRKLPARFLLFAVRSTNGAYTLVRGLPYRVVRDHVRFVERSEKITLERQTNATVASCDVRGELMLDKCATTNSWLSTAAMRQRSSNKGTPPSVVRTTVKCLDLLALEERTIDNGLTRSASSSELTVRVQLEPNCEKRCYTLALRAPADDVAPDQQLFSDVAYRVRRTLTTVKTTTQSSRKRRFPPVATKLVQTPSTPSNRHEDSGGHYLNKILSTIGDILVTAKRATTSNDSNAFATNRLSEKTRLLEHTATEFRNLVVSLTTQRRDHDASNVLSPDKRAIIETARRMLELVVQLTETLRDCDHLEAFREVTVLLRDMATTRA